MIKIVLAALIQCFAFGALTLAANNLQPVVADMGESPWSYNTTSEQADASDIFLPFASFILPGLGQWCRGQPQYGAIYSGVAVTGIMYAQNAQSDVPKTQTTSLDLATKNVAARKILLGGQTYQAMGGLSLYHTFRSSVWQRQKYGEYKFLGQGDSPKDILMAPFQFNYLARSSTWIPLGIVGIISYYQAAHPDSDSHREGLSKEDPWFAGAFSYNAGTHEEALFRGWGMPLLHEYGLSPGWSNFAQASLFAVAHRIKPLPLPQFFLGLHLGSVTQRNKWTLSEAIFIHVWWDVFAFLGEYHIEKNIQQNIQQNTTKSSGSSKMGPRPSLFLPPIDIHF